MKYLFHWLSAVCAPSPPSRGAWIEIILMMLRFCPILVAPLAGGVD